MTKPRIKKVKAPVVQKSKIIEIIAERLHGISRVPSKEQGKMVVRACNAARDYVEKIERKVKLLEKALKISVIRGRLSCLEGGVTTCKTPLHKTEKTEKIILIFFNFFYFLLAFLPLYHYNGNRDKKGDFRMAKNLKPGRICTSVYSHIESHSKIKSMLSSIKKVDVVASRSNLFGSGYEYSKLVERLLEKWFKSIKKARGLKELKLELLDKCPMSCSHCSSLGDPSGTLEIGIKKVKKIIDDFIGLGGEQLVFSGGEPLLYKKLPDAISYAEKGGVKNIRLYTTGIDNNKIDPVSEDKVVLLKGAGLTSAVFSLYGGSAGNHGMITRKKKSFSATLDAMEIFARVGIPVEVHFVPTKKNYKSLGSLVRLLREKGVKKISILRFVPHGRGEDNRGELEMGEAEYEDLGAKIKNLMKKDDIEIRLGSPMNFMCLHEQVECMAGIDRLCIIPSGLVFGCDAFKRSESEYGDNINDLTLKYIWECSEKLWYLRHIKFLGTEYNKVCSNCSNFKTCGGGCLAQKLISKNKSACGSDPSCFKKSVKKVIISDAV